jgi:hypothetical protein
MGQGAAVKKLALLCTLWAGVFFAPTASACACCVEAGSYSVQRGVSSYEWGEILAHKRALLATMDFGMGDSNTVFTAPAMNMQRDPPEFGLTWYIELTERDPATQRIHKVALRFTPEPAKKWTYIRRTSPLDKKRELSGLSHDFLIQGVVTVVSDKAKLMKDIKKITAQLTLYGDGNNCFEGSSLKAFLFEMTLLTKNGDSSHMVGEGPIK